jgi:hypothetical protein
MFNIKLVNSNARTSPKPPKINNVPVNVVAFITTHSQQSKQHEFKKRELVKAKRIEDWQQEEHLQDSFIEMVKQLQHGGTDK